MRGRVPQRPLAEVADAAVAVFIAHGFGRAGISDVSAAMGLSHGAVYTYAESKRALLYLALLRTLDPSSVEALAPPVATPKPEDCIAAVSAWAERQTEFPSTESLVPAAGSPHRPVEAELDEIVTLLYTFLERNRTAIALVERCAGELPELAQWYFVERRREVFARFGDYLRTRIEEGRLPPVPDNPAAARFIAETSAWFAFHRYGDPDSAMLDDDACRRTVRHLVVPHSCPTPRQRSPAHDPVL